MIMRKKIICIEDIIFDKRKEVLNKSIFKNIYFRISQFKEKFSTKNKIHKYLFDIIKKKT